MAIERVSGGDRIRELKDKRKKKARFRLGIAIVSVVIILGSVIFISRTRQLQIQSVVVRGNYIVSADDVKKSVQTILDQKYAWIIPKSNVLVYPNAKLRAEIAKQFPRFDSVHLHRENWGTLVIDVEERKSVYLWCDALPSQKDTQNQNCYYVDDRGYIFSRSPSFTGNVYFIFYGTYTWGANESPIGKKLFSDEYFKHVIRFKEGIASHGIIPYGFVMYSTTVSGFLLSPKFDDGIQKIVFTTSQDLSVLYENLLLALTSADLQKQLREEFDSLQYLDLRYDKKVYYKFGSSPDITQQETAPLGEVAPQ